MVKLDVARKKLVIISHIFPGAMTRNMFVIMFISYSLTFISDRRREDSHSGKIVWSLVTRMFHTFIGGSNI